MIDYARMQKQGPVLKRKLTIAKKQGYHATKQACREAVAEWDAIGAWPDNWSLWQRTLDDKAFDARHPLVRLEDLR